MRNWRICDFEHGAEARSQFSRVQGSLFPPKSAPKTCLDPALFSDRLWGAFYDDFGRHFDSFSAPKPFKNGAQNDVYFLRPSGCAWEPPFWAGVATRCSPGESKPRDFPPPRAVFYSLMAMDQGWPCDIWTMDI